MNLVNKKEVLEINIPENTSTEKVVTYNITIESSGKYLVNINKKFYLWPIKHIEFKSGDNITIYTQENTVIIHKN